MKIKLFTHTDLDGVGCAIIAHYEFRSNDSVEGISVQRCGYNNIDSYIEAYILTEEYKNYDVTFITDISVTEPVAEMINSVDDHKFRLYDHHKTALGLNKYPWANVEVELNGKPTCGTELFARAICVPHHLYHFVDMVRQYDTWEWKELDANEPYTLNQLFEIYGFERFENLMLNRLSRASEIINDQDYEFIKLDDDARDRANENAMRNMITFKFEKYNTAFIICSKYISGVASYILENDPTIDIVMALTDSYSVSLRSIRDDVDVAEIAKKHHGGGHKHAAGFTIHKDIIQFLLTRYWKVGLLWLKTKLGSWTIAKE